MNILLINQPLNNRGDEAAHKALVRAICNKLNDVQIRVLFVDADIRSVNSYNDFHNNVEYINIISKGFYIYERAWFIRHHDSKWMFRVFPTFKEIWLHYQWSDWVLCAPGGICMGGFQEWRHLFYLKIAKLAQKPLAYYGRSIGPFPTFTKRNRRFKALSEEMMNYFSFFSLRDYESEMIAKEMGVNCIRTIDTAFLESPHPNIPAEVKQLVNSNPYVIFVPNHLTWNKLYSTFNREKVLKLFSLIGQTITEKYPSCKVLMLPQTYQPGNCYDTPEMLFFKDLKRMIHSDNVIILKDSYSSDVQQSIIAESKMVIGARYHSIVFAINNNIPFIALCYEHKMNGMLHTLGLDNYICDIRHSLNTDDDIKNTINSFSNILHNMHGVRISRNKATTLANSCLMAFLEKIQ